MRLGGAGLRELGFAVWSSYEPADEESRGSSSSNENCSAATKIGNPDVKIGALAGLHAKLGPARAKARIQ